MPEWPHDIIRESRLATARLIREDFLEDEEIVTGIRKKVEEQRTYFEAYGGSLTTHDYVHLVLNSLCDLLGGEEA